MLFLGKIEHKLRPLMASLLPACCITKCYSGTRNWYIKKLGSLNIETVEGNFHSKELCGLTFRNDLGNAAGFDKDGSLLAFNYKLGAGFALVGTVLNKPHTGNLISAFGKKANPWVPLPKNDSAINSLGLPSKGIDKTLDNIKAFQDKYQPINFPVGLSIMGHPLENGEEKLRGVLDCVKKALPIVDFIEINESCPNVKHGDDDKGAFKQRIDAIMSTRGSDGTPIFVKLGKIGDVETTVQALVEAEVDGLVGLNTQTDYEHYRNRLEGDFKIYDYYTKNHRGGLSGKIIKEHAFSEMHKVSEFVKANELKLKLIHVGGISQKKDVIESRKHFDLREWYTCLMTALASKKSTEIYREMTAV